MLGFLVFQNIFLNLGVEARNKILGNIFNIMDVSVSVFKVVDEKIIFRLYSCGVFYQYIFRVGSGKNKVLSDDKIIYCEIFIFDDSIQFFNNFIHQLIHCQDEYQVYLLLRELL